MPQNVIAAFACILSVDLMGITLFFQLFLLRFFCCCCKNVLLCCWFNPFFPLSLTWKFNTGTLSPMNWIGLSVCSTISVKPLELQSRHTHTNTHSFSVDERERSRHLYKLRIVITKYSFEKRIRTHTHRIDCNRIDYYLHCMHARTQNANSFSQLNAMMFWHSSIRYAISFVLEEIMKIVMNE